MITSVQIRSFRCIQALDLTLGPFTALVGPNASGKSAVLAALDNDRPLKHSDYWQHGQTAPSYVFEIDGIPRLTAHHIGQSFRQPGLQYRYQVAHFEPEALRQQNQLQRATHLWRDGSNLANVFATLPRAEQIVIAKSLASLVPGIADVDTQPTSGGQHQLRFFDAWKSGVEYTPDEISDGTLLILAYLVLVQQRPCVDLLAIEEPERGLHPYLIGELIGFLRKLTTGEVGPQPTQVLIATHSVEVLDFLQPHEVRFLTRDPATGTVEVRSAPTESAEWQKALKEYGESLGSLWLSGQLGGVPGR